MAKHTITITNLKLTDKEFQRAKKQLANYTHFTESKNGKSISRSGISDAKTVYSVDCGAIVSELSAFLLAVDFYLGEYRKSVEIKSMRC